MRERTRRKFDLRCRGTTRLAVLVVILCIVVFIVISTIVSAALRVNRHDRYYQVRDATQLQQIYKGFVTFGRNFDGSLPKPGLVDRVGDQIGVGEEDVSLNTTANLFSMTIAQNYFTPQLLLAPSELNPRVTAHNDYNIDAYDPGNDVYWDETFAADLEKGSNVSYAHMALVGESAETEWRDTQNSEWILMANRGPKGGAKLPGSYTTDRKGNWLGGNVLYADGHVEWWDAIESYSYIDNRGIQQEGNIYEDHPDDQRGNTVAFTKEVKDGKPIFQWD